ncbi:phytoene desaturase family protein [Aeromicrobium sp. UC242_57]|uniref:phytoene desaturase family protein n=1 Tax=Aeromicrobium sp. UC242_57 TaxID=3374624 RepID=UPI0037A0E9F6
MTTAVVVGSGPNGLSAAVVLARAGIDVTVLEAEDEIGGGTRSAELNVPGVLHDICSATHPTGVASPFFRSLGLEKHGLEWLWPEIDAVHPLDGGRAGVLFPRSGPHGRAARRGREGLAKAVRAARRPQRRSHRRDLRSDPARAEASDAAGAVRSAGDAAGVMDRPTLEDRRGAGAVRRSRRPRDAAARPAHDRWPRAHVRGHEPRLWLACRQGRLDRDRGRSGGRARRPRRTHRDRPPGHRASAGRHRHVRHVAGCGPPDHRRPPTGTGPSPRCASGGPARGRSRSTSPSKAASPGPTRTPAGPARSTSAAPSSSSARPSAMSTQDGCRNARSSWCASSTSPIRVARPAMSTRSGRTRTCRRATPVMRRRR